MKGGDYNPLNRNPRYVAIKERPEPRISKLQPELCKGCIWGRWDGVKQFCGRPICPKE